MVESGFSVCGGEWWREKMVVESDIWWRVVETLLFLWRKAWKIKVFQHKKYYENRHFGVVFSR